MPSRKIKINLVETWLTVALGGADRPPTYALEDLNEALETSYSLTRFNEWRRGDRSMPEPVRLFMMRQCVRYALHEALGKNVYPTDEQLETFVELIAPPERR